MKKIKNSKDFKNRHRGSGSYEDFFKIEARKGEELYVLEPSDENDMNRFQEGDGWEFFGYFEDGKRARIFPVIACVRTSCKECDCEGQFNTFISVLGMKKGDIVDELRCYEGCGAEVYNIAEGDLVWKKYEKSYDN